MFSKVKGEELDGVLINNLNDVILVSFSTRYSGEARMMDASIKELTREYDSGVQFFCIDADENLDYIAAKGIHQLPTLVIYYNAELVYHGVGLHSKSSLRKMINQFLSRSIKSANQFN